MTRDEPSYRCEITSGDVPREPIVAGEPAAERLMRALDYRLSPPQTRRLTAAEVAVVLHALADHTAIMTALKWRCAHDSPWPEAVSVGRWFHDVADQLERLPRHCPRAGLHNCGGSWTNHDHADGTL